jgi:hypothetical protein
MNIQRRHENDEPITLNIQPATLNIQHEIEILEKRIVPTGSGETVLPL